MKIGVFVCHCGLNIAGVLDVRSLSDYAKSLKYVEYSKDLKYACSDSGIDEISKAIRDYKLDRVVIAACSPRLHEHTFQRVLEENGLNPYMLVIANIREQCSWVHSGLGANLKARDIVRMAVARARTLKPIERVKVPVKRSVLVVGGGVTGITASSILSKFTKVYLVEKSPTIGGHMALLNEVFPTNDCSICILAPMMSEVWRNPNVDIITNAEVVGVEGSVGNFRVKVIKKPRFVSEEKCRGCIEICSNVCPVYTNDMRKAIHLPIPQSIPMCAVIDTRYCIGCMLCAYECPEDAIDFDQNPEELNLDVGAIIVATGHRVGGNIGRRIINLMYLERLLSASGPTGGKLLVDGKKPNRVAFVLCYGSRDEDGKSYCSRVCCLATLKNVVTMKRRNPEVEIWIFYIDMRAYNEELYKKVQEMGVKFVRGKPKIFELDDRVILRFEDTLRDELNEEYFDLVVLATPIEGNPELSNVLGVSVDENGFFIPSHPKLRPVETNVRGIFLAGTSSSPMDIRECVESAGLASAKALEIVLSDHVESEPFFAKVDERCTGCRTCECHFNAIKMNEKASIDPHLCVGCGLCMASCPSDAIDLNYFTDEGITSEINALAEEKCMDPLILMFACKYCAYSALDLAGIMKVQYPPNVRTIMVPCSGSVKPEWIVHALKRGIDGVIVAGCKLGECHFKIGNYKARSRIESMKEMLGKDSWRLKEVWRSAGDLDIVRDIEEFLEEVRWRRGLN